MEQQPYYLAYEKRYRAVFEAGAERWGHSPDDQELFNALKEWVTANHLTGKSIIEFACGEGAGGIIPVSYTHLESTSSLRIANLSFRLLLVST